MNELRNEAFEVVDFLELNFIRFDRSRGGKIRSIQQERSIFFFKQRHCDSAVPVGQKIPRAARLTRPKDRGEVVGAKDVGLLFRLGLLLIAIFFLIFIFFI